MCYWQYVTPLIGLVTGALIGIFAEPIRTRIFRPVLKVSFDKDDLNCVTRTPTGPTLQSEGYYIRARVENPKSQMAKFCRAFLVRVEKRNAKGDFEPTIYSEGLPIGWSSQQDVGRPLELPSGIFQYADIISTDKSAPNQYSVNLILYPHRYRALFDNTPQTLRFTILITGDGAKAGMTSIIFEWRGQWDNFVVTESKVGELLSMNGPPTAAENEKLFLDRANVITQVRNQLLTEGFKGLIAINAGGAVALGAFVQAVWGKPTAAPMLIWILSGICWLIWGTAFAAIGFVARHLSFFHRNTTEPFRNPWWWTELGVIIASIIFFMIGMGTAVYGAFVSLH